MSLFSNFKDPVYIKTFLIAFLVSGGTFATIMAAIDYNDKMPFKLSQFIFYFLFLGLIMGYVFAKKNPKK